MIRRITILVAALVFFTQLLTLNWIEMNGDEAVYTLILQEIAKIRAGEWPAWNPIVHYAGPLDFWILGGLYALIAECCPTLQTGAWMVRLVPFLLVWAGIVAVFLEWKKRSDEGADWFLLFAAVSPMVLVYSRTAFPHTVLLAIFFFLFSESLRILRTGEVRWFRIALVAGISAEAHPTTYMGLLAVFGPAVPAALPAFRKQWKRALLAALVFVALCFTVLKNLPFPIGNDGTRGTRPLIELRNFLNIVSGHQQIYWLLFKEMAPIPVLVTTILGTLCVLYWRARGLFRGFYKTVLQQGGAALGAGPKRDLRLVWLGHSILGLVLLWTCYRARSLTLIGHERYLFTLVPGWILLSSDAFLYLKNSVSWLKIRAWVLPVFVALFFGLRFFMPLFQLGLLPGRIYEPAARWLTQECPRSECVVTVEDFWLYWPVRFYTRSHIEIDTLSPLGTTQQAFHPPAGRRVVGCWFYSEIDSAGRPQTAYEGSYKDYRLFPPVPGWRGVACYRGIPYVARP